MKIPLLEGLLPEGWDRTGFADHPAASREVDEALRDLPFSDIRYEELSEAQRSQLSDFMYNVRQSQRQRYLNALDLVGQSEKSLDRFAAEIEEFHGNEMGQYLPIRSYASPLSFLFAMFGEDLTGRTILEVGHGKDGVSVLGYLSSKGARAIALDCDSDLKEQFIGKGIGFISGRWEDIALYIGPDEIDAIYMQFMHNHPEIGGIFQDEIAYSSRLGTSYDEKHHVSTRRGCRRRFDEHVAKEMAKVLAPRGFFLLRNLDQEQEWKAEYVIRNSEAFTEQGYEYFEFRRIPARYGICLDVMQRTE